MKSKFKFLTLILALSLFIVACGQDNKKDTTGEGKTEGTTQEEQETKDNNETANNTTEETQANVTDKETTEETKDDTNAGINKPEPGKLDVNKLLDSLNGNDGNIKPFSVKVVGSQKIVENGKPQQFNAESDVVYDGKTQYTKSKMGNTYEVTYKTIEGDKVTVLRGLGKDENNLTFTKSSEDIAGNIGISFGTTEKNKPEWKFEGANGNIERYKATYDPKSIEENQTESMKFKDTSGGIDVVVEYDRSKNQIVSIHSKGQIKTTMVTSFDKTKDPVETKLEQELDSKYTDFKFDGIETVTIPEEAKSAKELDYTNGLNDTKGLDNTKGSDDTKKVNDTNDTNNKTDVEALQKDLDKQIEELDKALEELDGLRAE
ncbi:hypothetical protein HMPREF9709_00322 [Helcococcus kunzii ATCC 51366]|uniref:Uncharacterized protein n=1 Tax=Helcococcus kunzii ATCC 51366 TaxID=883114 RepID=H3NLW1_9FIRM|nr:hypothetical protein [Helcococcus kunzii]EHR35631.1 hypothetical protein HMPREF9709_00322 [Helcococcus kunzii ATCC 51366]